MRAGGVGGASARSILWARLGGPETLRWPFGSKFGTPVSSQRKNRSSPAQPHHLRAVRGAFLLPFLSTRLLLVVQMAARRRRRRRSSGSLALFSNSAHATSRSHLETPTLVKPEHGARIDPVTPLGDKSRGKLTQNRSPNARIFVPLTVAVGDASPCLFDRPQPSCPLTPPAVMAPRRTRFVLYTRSIDSVEQRCVAAKHWRGPMPQSARPACVEGCLGLLRPRTKKAQQGKIFD